MDTLVSISVEALRLVPLVLAFYIPALLGVAILKERGEAYRLKAAVLFAAGFGLILAIQLLLRSVSAAQVAGTLSLSAIQIAVALACAYITVYKLAD
jgi:hypothetical protein